MVLLLCTEDLSTKTIVTTELLLTTLNNDNNQNHWIYSSILIMQNLNQATAVIFEQLSNRLLSLDCEAHTQLSQFSNKIIQLKITDLNLNYFFIFPGGNLIIKSHCERPPSALISGKLIAFLNAASSTNSGDAIFTGDLHFSGEISTARQFQNVIQSLEIDWQEPFAQIFGDLVGHTLTTGIKHAGQFAQNLFSNLRQDIPEYLQEELRVLPTQCEIDSYCEHIDTLRSQSDRLDARIHQLTERLPSNSHE